MSKFFCFSGFFPKPPEKPFFFKRSKHKYNIILKRYEDLFGNGKMHKKMKINVEGWRKAQNSKVNFASPKEMYTNTGNTKAEKNTVSIEKERDRRKKTERIVEEMARSAHIPQPIRYFAQKRFL